MKNDESKPKTKTKEKKSPCHTCKKKSPVQLETIVELPPLDLHPTADEIAEAYFLFGSRVIDDTTYNKINSVYKRIFNENLVRGCGTCGERYFQKFKYYVDNVLKINPNDYRKI